MQAKNRYLLVLLSCAFLAYCYFGGYRPRLNGEGSTLTRTRPWTRPSTKLSTARPKTHTNLKSYIYNSDSYDQYLASSSHVGATNWSSGTVINTQTCRMETCFDFTKCRNNFKVYIYPPNEETEETILTPRPSASYQKVLNVIQESRYYTADPTEACIFVLALDTLDRDTLSSDYVRHMPAHLKKLSLWNGGQNHVIFNLYSGTWPNYLEDNLGFDPGFAILAKASISIKNFRPGFDISIPLFHKNHPQKGGEPGFVSTNNFPVSQKYLLAFKGKRYIHGIGSETRNSLYHLHNKNDIVLVTTCRHGKNWKELKDERCDEDNAEYDRYDYGVLLQNSTFCLVPRGRRLGSFRFLEALQAGCIPVLLSNSWALPFAQVVDWNKAVIWADERLLMQVPDIVRSVSATKVFALRQQTQILWESYFSSIQKIVFTTLEIIRERIPIQPHRDSLIWNFAPGALLTLPHFSDTLSQYPFYLDVLGTNTGSHFTAVIYSQPSSTASSVSGSPMYRLIKNVANSRNVSRIIVIWSSENPPPPRSHWPSTPSNVPLNILLPNSFDNGFQFGLNTTEHQSQQNYQRSIGQRFYPHRLIQTAAVLSLDEDCLLTTDEVDFAFQVWKSFPDRIVGYPARSHYWEDSKGSWGYTSKWTNDYSIVLTGAAFYHRYYNFAYTNWLSSFLLKTVEQSQNCEDILMNFLVSHITRRPPIKVTQRKKFKEQPSGRSRSPQYDDDHFVQRQTCLNTFAAGFGYMPLLRSNVRLDPVLYKDPVSNLRKKYRQIELIGS